VPNTHKSKRLLDFHRSVIDLMGVMNRPQADDILISAAGISLDRALVPLLVRIERLAPIGIVDLADRAGRDYTTVSRQVAKLERMKLVTRRAAPADRRVREALITDKGKTMVQAVDAARDRLFAPVLAKWSDRDFDSLVRLTRRFVDDLLDRLAERGL
jgi:DNA-binding MarR family transcriptional regulator